MKKLKYLVTGGNGFIGSALVRRLHKEGYPVRVIDNYLRGKNNRLADIASELEIINGDIRDGQVVQDACKGMDGVFHLAYLNGTEFFYTKPDLVLDIAVRGQVNVLEGCLKHGVKEFFLASSSEVYQTPAKIPTPENVPLVVPDPLNPRYSYGGGKIISELMTMNYGRKHFKRAIIFRPHNVYGPDMGYEHVVPQLVLRMKDLAQKTKGRIKFPIEGTGNETRSFVFIDDFVDGLMQVVKKGKHMEIYHIGTMEEIAIKKVVGLVAQYFQRDIRMVRGPLKKGGTKRRCPDISKLKKLGYRPKISFKEGFNITAKWYDNNVKT